MRGLSRADVARRLEVRPATVTEWFTRGRRPSGTNLARLARLLGVSVDWLLEAPGLAGTARSAWGPRQAATYRNTALLAMRDAAGDVLLETLFEATASGASPAAIYDDVLGPALHDLGKLWACGEVGIADEHAAASATAAALARFAPRVSRTGLGRALVTAVDGERHWLGAAMVSAGMRADGWQVRFLGGDLPHREVARAAEAFEPDVVLLSTVQPALLDATRELVDVLRQVVEDTIILVGGYAWLSDEADALQLDVDASGTSVAEAIDLARRLATRRR